MKRDKDPNRLKQSFAHAWREWLSAYPETDPVTAATRIVRRLEEPRRRNFLWPILIPVSVSALLLVMLLSNRSVRLVSPPVFSDVESRPAPVASNMVTIWLTPDTPLILSLTAPENTANNR